MTPQIMMSGTSPADKAGKIRLPILTDWAPDSVSGVLWFDVGYPAKEQRSKP
jgi:hypothetical protein